MTEEKFKWWGYRHTNGGYQVKRYFDRQDIKEANESPFCQFVTGPFDAKNREEAFDVLMVKLGDNND